MFERSTNNQAKLGTLEHVNLAICKTQNPKRNWRLREQNYYISLFMHLLVAISGWKEELQVV